MYYIYRHVRLDTNMPFYIGKGKCRPNRRTFKSCYYRAFSQQGRSVFWKSIFDKTEIRVDILFESDCEDTIFRKEMEFISIYGRSDLNKGSLCNLTDGGEGECGRIVSDESRMKYSKINKGRKYSKEINAKKGLSGDLNPMFGVRRYGIENPFYGKKHKEESKKFGKDNPMFGKCGNLNPAYGMKHSDEFLRRKQILHSNKVLVIIDDKLTIFECVSDCANYFKCTTKNILFRDKQRKKGIKAKSGIFKNVYLEIIK